MRIEMSDNIKNRLRIEIEKAYYAHKRYKIETTFAILYHENNLEVKKLGKIVRITDHLLKIDKHHYFINFVHTDHNKAFKAAQNLLQSLDFYFNNRSSFIAIDTFNTTQSPKIVLSRLEQILKTIRKTSYARIDDENILNEIV
jgi:hypothetical protein